VDTRLRPTGSKGPLVQSIEAFRSYYSGQSETWERQALLKGRCVAGDRNVGASFCHMIAALIYREADQAVLAHDVLAMRKRMEDETGKENEDFFNIKQGAGGLVDIEFLVQYLQLLYGMRYPRVRVPGTYDALRAFARLKIIDEHDSGNLQRSYLFFRRLESRMRIVSNQATNLLTRDPEKLLPLARRMGYADSGMMTGKKLLAEYEELSGEVRSIFDRLLGRKAG
jgi:[glutamine synthetase] adenylyltransferase / [glutamine synthetase]-adenylyl-L-tyrosine phosphorylase